MCTAKWAVLHVSKKLRKWLNEYWVLLFALCATCEGSRSV